MVRTRIQSAKAGPTVLWGVVALSLMSLVGLGCGAGGDGSGERRKVSDVEILTFLASPRTIEVGESATLSWTTRGARQIILIAAGEVLRDKRTEPNGVVEVQPTHTTTYLLRALGARGEVSKEVTVSVQPSIISFEVVSDPPAILGAEVELRWETLGAAALHLSNGEAFDQAIPEAAIRTGTMLVPVPASGAFELIATSGPLLTSATATVEVVDVPLPQVDAFLAEPAAITRGHPQVVELMWLVEGADRVELRRDGVLIELDEGATTYSLELSDEASFELRAGNEAGLTRVARVVEGVDPPEITEFRALPRRVGAGESFELRWNTAAAETRELTLDGSEIGPSPLPESGSLEQQLAVDGQLRLVAKNRLGFAVEEIVQVTVGAPLIRSLEVDPRTASEGAPLTFSWSCEGGTSLRLLDPEGDEIVGCSTADPSQIESGSCVTLAPQTLGAHRYQLVVESLGGEARQDVLAHVSDGPVIASFEAAPAWVFEGEEVTLSWEVLSDPAGVVPTLTLTDVLGNDFSDLLPTDGASVGALVLELAEVGTYEFILTASTPGTTDAVAHLQVVARPIPTVSLSATPNPLDILEGEEVALSWTTTNGEWLWIWALDGDGNPIEPAIVELDDQAEVASGEITVSPLESTTYRAMVRSPFGDDGSAELFVHLLQVEILSFAADPDEVFKGGEITLEWVTDRAETVELFPYPGYTVREESQPFIELRDSGTATELTPSQCVSGYVNGCEDLSFPGGFTFPFDGRVLDRARVFTNGVLGFDSSVAVNSNLNREIPTGDPWTELLAVFWDALPSGAGEPKLLYDLGEDDRGEYLAIEWSQFRLAGTGRPACTRAISFQVLLRGDGSFEYRYGPFGSPVNTCALPSPTVGLQHSGGRDGLLLFFDEEPQDGFEGRSYLFTPAPLLTSDRVSLEVKTNQRYTLIARGAKGRTATKTVDVITHSAPTIASLGSAPAAPEAGAPAVIEWETADVLSIDVLDSRGSSVCTNPSSMQLPKGGCSILETAGGEYVYTVRAGGALGSVVEEEIIVVFHEPLMIASFTAAPAAIDHGAGESVTLSWESSGAQGLHLWEEARGGELRELAVAEELWAVGQLEVTPSADTTYRLSIESGWIIKEAAAEVQVRTFAFDATPPAVIQSRAHASVELGWEARAIGGAAPPEVVLNPLPGMIELYDSPFVDISGTGVEIEGFGQQETRSSMVNFPDGFTFPFYGEERTFAVMTTGGYLSFDEEAANYGPAGINQALVTGNPLTVRMNIVPFWHNFRTYSVGRAHQQLVEVPGAPQDDHLIFQWSRMQSYVVTTPAPGEETDDFTFQAILYRNGSIEFRYGTMESPDRPEVAGGQVASIGFQDRTATKGLQLIYNLSNPVPWSHRTFRYSATGPSATVVVNPAETTVYEICVSSGEHRRCVETVVFIPAAGDVAISELHLQPVGGADDQWLELRNLTPYPLDLRGMELRGPAGAVLLEGDGGLAIESGGYFTLGAGLGSFRPDHSYSLPSFLPLAGTLALYDGDRELTSIHLDESWPLVEGRSLSLDPVNHLRGIAEHSQASRWCLSSGAGSPGVGEGCLSPFYEIDPYAGRPFLDIERSGVPLAAPFSQVKAGMIPGGLGFSMPYFSDTVESLWVTINGALAFTGGPEALGLIQPIPSPDGVGPGLVAPYWAALKREHPTWGPRASIRYERRVVQGQRVLIVQWSNVKRPDTGANVQEGWLSFQAQIWENGDIVFAYRDMSRHPDHFGANAVVGLEAIGGGEGIQYLHDRPVLWPGQAILFQRRGQ